ncbi:hypothetical protein [Cohnella soli]|uniref:AMP-dependent synthetase and ligase n=1 Tax=Cohnella soli TaxID=425005 RepID=A0ABW0HYR4_9BACL
MNFGSNNHSNQSLQQCEQIIQQLVNQTQQASQNYQQLLQQEQQNAQRLEELAHREQKAAQMIQTALQGHQTVIQQLQQVSNLCRQIEHSAQMQFNAGYNQSNQNFAPHSAYTQQQPNAFQNHNQNFNTGYRSMQ